MLDCNLPARERVDEVMNRAEKGGGKIIHEARDAEWGARVGHFADPDGYDWQVSSQ